MRPLSVGQILLYSAANVGLNMVYAFANFAFPLYLRAYPVPNLLVGFLAQERSFVGSFVQPVVGIISDRLPPNPLGRRRPFFLVGIPLTVVALFLLSLYPPVWSVVAIMTLFSFFIAVAADPYMALMPDISPPEQRGRIGGVMAICNMVGQVTVVLLSFLLWETRQTELFWLIAAGVLLFFGITFFGVSEPPIVRVRDDGRLGCRFAVVPYARGVFAQREVVKYLFVTFFFWLGNGGIVPFVTRFGTDVLGTNENDAFLLVLPAILGTALFAVPAGMLTERLGKKLVLAAGILGFGSFALAGGLFVATTTQLLVMMSLVGVANAITTALMFPLLADLVPEGRTGEFVGVGAMVWSLSQTIGALSAGALADLSGTFRASFAVGGVCMLVGFILLLRVQAPSSA